MGMIMFYKALGVMAWIVAKKYYVPPTQDKVEEENKILSPGKYISILSSDADIGHESSAN